jgi:hypothetical protein
VQIEVTAISPTYGGVGAIDLVGEYLVEGLPPVGEAVDRIEVGLLLVAQPSAPPERIEDGVDIEALLLALGLDAGGADVGDDIGIFPGHPDWGRTHEGERQKGSSLVFRRTARRVVLRLVSTLSELDVFGSEPASRTFATAAREIVSGLDPLRRRAKKNDDLDLAALTAHLEARLAVLPQTDDELDAVLEPLRAARARQWAAMSPWDVVDVDWTLFAPQARTLLDDPFFWDPADDDAPHGSDTGADVLTDLMERPHHDARTFLEQQARDWGFESLVDLAQHDPHEHDTLVVATAFAQLKLTAQISSSLRDLAVRALQRRAGDEPTATDELLMSALVRAPPAT